MSFWNFIRIIRARKWVIIGIMAVTLMVLVIAVPTSKKVYEATTYMSPTPQVMQGGVNSVSPQNQQNLTSREVVLSSLIVLAQGGDIYQKAMDFLAMPVDEQKTKAPGLPNYKQITRVEIEPGKALSFKDWGDVLEVAPVSNPAIGENGTTTNIIRITVKMNSEDLPPYIANAVGQAFIEGFREKSREDIKSYERFLFAARKEARQSLESLQNEIEQHKHSHKVVAVDAETQSAITALANLQAEKNHAEAEVRESQALLANINSQLAGQPALISQKLPADMSPAVGKLKDELAAAEAEQRDLGRRYTPAHEAYKAAAARVRDLRQRIQKESASFTQSRFNDIRQNLLKRKSETSADLNKALAHLDSLNASTAQAESNVNEISRLEPALTTLLREKTLAEKKYNDLSEKYAETLISEQETTRTGAIIPFGWARVSTGPVRQGPTLAALLGYGLLLALLMGMLAAIWLDSIDNRLRSAGDVEKLLELPVMGLTPELAGRNGALPKLTHLYPLSPMAESYRILRTKVILSMRKQPFKTLMVATGRPQQGATTIICNLAIALAQSGMRIILIDADMRQPSLHVFFGVSNTAGLSTLLQSDGILTDAFQKTEIENLVVVPAGPTPVNPSELLASNRARDVVEKLRDHCDLVLFDTPSAAVFSDGLVLASYVDTALMVIAANQVPRRSQTEIRDLLRQTPANIIGVVVNRMQPDSIDNCFFYARYYQDQKPSKRDGRTLPYNDEKMGRPGSMPVLIGEPSGSGKTTDSDVDDDDLSPLPE